MKIRTAKSGTHVPQFVVEPENKDEAMLLGLMFGMMYESKGEYEFVHNGPSYKDGEVFSFNFGLRKKSAAVVPQPVSGEEARGGWQEWHGKASRPPLPVAALVQVKFRSGVTPGVREVWRYRWEHVEGENSATDILAYLVVESSQKTTI